MSRQIVTAEDIRMAYKQGMSELAISQGALITPQAKDDAKARGIHVVERSEAPVVPVYGLAREEELSPDQTKATLAYTAALLPPPPDKGSSFPAGAGGIGTHTSPVPQLPPLSAYGAPALPRAPVLPPPLPSAARSFAAPLPEPVLQNARSVAPSLEKSPPTSAVNDAAALREEVCRRVMQSIPEGAYGRDLVKQLVQKATAEALAAVLPAQGCCTAPSAAVAPAQQGSLQAGVSKADGFRSRAGGVIRVDQNRLPWTDFSEAPCPELINIVDVITTGDGAPMGGGYLEWDKASFPWTLTYDEINIVLEGELHISCGGQTVVARRGDMSYLPKGSSVVFASPGYVKFAYVTWPADWAAQGS